MGAVGEQTFLSHHTAPIVPTNLPTPLKPPPLNPSNLHPPAATRVDGVVQRHAVLQGLVDFAIRELRIGCVGGEECEGAGSWRDRNLSRCAAAVGAGFCALGWKQPWEWVNWWVWVAAWVLGVALVAAGGVLYYLMVWCLIDVAERPCYTLQREVGGWTLRLVPSYGLGNRLFQYFVVRNIAESLNLRFVAPEPLSKPFHSLPLEVPSVVPSTAEVGRAGPADQTDGTEGRARTPKRGRRAAEEEREGDGEGGGAVGREGVGSGKGRKEGEEVVPTWYMPPWLPSDREELWRLCREAPELSALARIVRRLLIAEASGSLLIERLSASPAQRTPLTLTESEAIALLSTPIAGFAQDVALFHPAALLARSRGMVAACIQETQPPASSAEALGPWTEPLHAGNSPNFDEWEGVPVHRALRAATFEELRSGTLVVHVRLGDILTGIHRSYRPLPLSFFRDAVRRLDVPRLHTVVLVGDDKPSPLFTLLARALLPPAPHARVVLQGLSVPQDLLTLHNASALVLSTSTFAWWAAFAHSHPLQRTVFPRWGVFEPCTVQFVDGAHANQDLDLSVLDPARAIPIDLPLLPRWKGIHELPTLRDIPQGRSVFDKDD
jgi:hypothetical protein